MTHFPEEFDSIFRYIEVVSQRAEQLIRGARPRTESKASKRTLQAREDVDAGTVAWRVLTQEELDARRQEMAEQFRAEMAGEEGAPGAEDQPVQDVLPTSAEPTAEGADVEEGRDEELDRLQRLLGMIGAPDTGDSGEADEADQAEEAEAIDIEEDSGDTVDEED